MRKTVIAVVAASLLLAGCANTDDEAASSATPTSPGSDAAGGEFQARDVEPIVVDDSDFAEPVHDTGLNVEFHFQGTRAGNYGGTVVDVAVTNLNDVALPPDALGAPELRYNTGSGESLTEAEPLETTTPEGAPPLQVPLDLPLGAGATTNLHYTFAVTRTNLWDAEFEIGNVIFAGNLIA